MAVVDAGIEEQSLQQFCRNIGPDHDATAIDLADIGQVFHPVGMHREAHQQVVIDQHVRPARHNRAKLPQLSGPPSLRTCRVAVPSIQKLTPLVSTGAVVAELIARNASDFERTGGKVHRRAIAACRRRNAARRIGRSHAAPLPQPGHIHGTRQQSRPRRDEIARQRREGLCHRVHIGLGTEGDDRRIRRAQHAQQFVGVITARPVNCGFGVK